ncbi:hypothetical protein Tsubulata_050118 [Turnera subulata]|uniref:Uncharacterized protein n=1 Tax=Turnera subulata TaxID=218843 RepID=A0A9Q0JQQ5_9ROSI|nr:hypothetical protein Tsubulata_050118 [Turnera subulata]
MSTIPSSIVTFSTNSFRFPASYPLSPSKLPPCHYPRFCSPGKRPPRLVSSNCSEAEEASPSSSSSPSTEDEWLQKLPDKKRPLFAHSLPCIEAWLRNLGFFQSREDRAVWLVEKPEWHAQLSLDVTDLYIR